MTVIKEQRKLLARLEKIKFEISEIGEMRTGSLTEQYNVCGQQNCKCKDKENPQKHGPYYQLSYTRYKKSTSEFVSKDRVASVRQHLSNYKLFMSLKDEWIDISIQLAKLRRKK
jgi:hypothetical protein